MGGLGSCSDDSWIYGVLADEGPLCFFGGHKCHFLRVWCFFICVSRVEYGLTTNLTSPDWSQLVLQRPRIETLYLLISSAMTVVFPAVNMVLMFQVAMLAGCLGDRRFRRTLSIWFSVCVFIVSLACMPQVSSSPRLWGLFFFINVSVINWIHFTGDWPMSFTISLLASLTCFHLSRRWR